MTRPHTTVPLAVPPLDPRRPPVRVVLRALLWRVRFIVAALLTAVAVSATVHALRPPPPPAVPVVVAARAVPAGTTLGPSDLAVHRVPADLAATGAASDPGDVLGSATAVPLTPGTPLVPGVLAASAVRGPPGTVVAAVRLADPAVARLLVPGDRVDVLAVVPESTTGTVVASRALVLPPPDRPGQDAAGAAGGSGSGVLGGLAGPSVLGGSDESPALLLAVTPSEAAALAGATAAALLSAVVVP